MKLHKYLGFFVVSFLLLGLIVVSQWRNDQREIERLEVIFANDTHNFLNVEMVDKLLIQNEPLSHIGVKDTLALSSIEAELEAYDVILNAEIFMSQSKLLIVRVEERTPLLRIIGEESFYVDLDAVKIPLSDNFSAHVPLFFGNPSDEKIKELIVLIQKVNKDEFLKSQIIEIENQKGKYFFKMRSYDFLVELGNLNSFDQKVMKLKTFCKYLDSIEEQPNFTKINLKYYQQVIASS
jgi:cell division protein FtsQ